MRLFNMSIRGLVIRLFLFMLIILAGAYIGLPWWLLIILGMLVFLSGFFGITGQEMKETLGDDETKQEEQRQTTD